MSTVMLDYVLPFLNDESFMPIDCSDGYFSLHAPFFVKINLQRHTYAGQSAVICRSAAALSRKITPDDVMVMSSGLPQQWCRRKMMAVKSALPTGVVKTRIFRRQSWSLQRDKYQVAFWELGDVLFDWSACREFTRYL